MIDRYLKYERVVVKRVKLDRENPKAVIPLNEQFEYVKFEQVKGSEYVMAYINLPVEEQTEENGIIVDVYNLELSELLVKSIAVELFIPPDEDDPSWVHETEVQVILMK